MAAPIGHGFQYCAHEDVDDHEPMPPGNDLVDVPLHSDASPHVASPHVASPIHDLSPVHASPIHDHELEVAPARLPVSGIFDVRSFVREQCIQYPKLTGMFLIAHGTSRYITSIYGDLALWQWNLIHLSLLLSILVWYWLQHHKYCGLG